MPKIKESFILERSVVDAHARTMTSEMRNLDWDAVLSVVENQVYTPAGDAATDVRTVVKFESKLGAARRAAPGDDAPAKRGWLGGWGASGVQRSIELVGRSRMREGLARSREGMHLVLERLRERGFVGVVTEQRAGGWARWRKAWRDGMDGPGERGAGRGGR